MRLDEHEVKDVFITGRATHGAGRIPAMIRGVQIRAARVADLQAILHVLDTCALRCSDVDPSSHLVHIAALGKEVIGCACGERHGQAVVIQAVGALPAYRDQQLATHLVGAVLMRARANGCTTAALFTTAHPRFFRTIRLLPYLVGLVAERGKAIEEIFATLWRKDVLHVPAP